MMLKGGVLAVKELTDVYHHGSGIPQRLQHLALGRPHRSRVPSYCNNCNWRWAANLTFSWATLPTEIPRGEKSDLTQWVLKIIIFTKNKRQALFPHLKCKVAIQENKTKNPNKTTTKTKTNLNLLIICKLNCVIYRNKQKLQDNKKASSISTLDDLVSGDSISSITTL